MKKLIISALAALAAIPAFAQVDLNRTVATVNGEAIMGGEYYRRMEYLPGVGKVIGGSFAQAPPGFFTIDQLINERLLLQLAKEKGLEPTKAEVDAEIKIMSGDEPDKFLQGWVANGGTQADLEYSAKLRVAEMKLQTRGVVVTDQEVEQHYKANPTSFTVPRLVELRVITVDSDAARTQVDADLKAGKAFADVAKERSIDLTKVAGGLLSPRPLESLDPEFKAAIEKVKVGQVTDWVPSKGAYTKMLYEKVTPSKTFPLDDKLKLMIKRQLLFNRGRAKPENDLAKMMSNMRAKAKINITDKNFSETYQKMLKTANGG